MPKWTRELFNSDKSLNYEILFAKSLNEVRTILYKYLPDAPITPEDVQTLLENNEVAYTQTDDVHIICTFQGRIIGSKKDFAETQFEVQFHFVESTDTDSQLDTINISRIIQSS
ncbi:MAG: hypothetical protein AAFV98_02410 [Chloroflexota bacterium]